MEPSIFRGSFYTLKYNASMDAICLCQCGTLSEEIELSLNCYRRKRDAMDVHRYAFPICVDPLSLSRLSPKLLQFQPSQWRVHNARKCNRHPSPNITSIIPNLQRDRPLVPHLLHPNNSPCPTHKPSEQRRSANGQPLLILPCRPVERHTAKFVEDKMLFQRDGKPRANPVAHDG